MGKERLIFMITEFKGDYLFLSNFYPAPLDIDGIHYLNSEAAFQAHKLADPQARKAFSALPPNAAKMQGRKAALRPDWEDVKLDVMYKVCKAKFTQNKTLGKKLIGTGSQELIEGNTWGDKIWGQVNGEGENNLGKILMKIRAELMIDAITDWIKRYFEENAKPDTKAIIGISGGKDSSVAAALCVRALGKDRVVGVLMPQGEQADIGFSQELVDFLDIKNYTINIGDTVATLMREINPNVSLTEQAIINTPARVRMTTLYAVAACLGGRVVNTCNLSEDWVGYATKFGDAAGDFSPLSELTVSEILQIGDALGLPYDLVHKVPIDGLCGKTDEENLGFSYALLDEYIRGLTDLSDQPEIKEKIDKLHAYNMHKLLPMPRFVSDIPTIR